MRKIEARLRRKKKEQAIALARHKRKKEEEIKRKEKADKAEKEKEHEQALPDVLSKGKNGTGSIRGEDHALFETPKPAQTRIDSSKAITLHSPAPSNKPLAGQQQTQQYQQSPMNQGMMMNQQGQGHMNQGYMQQNAGMGGMNGGMMSPHSHQMNQGQMNMNQGQMNMNQGQMGMGMGGGMQQQNYMGQQSYQGQAMGGSPMPSPNAQIYLQIDMALAGNNPSELGSAIEQALGAGLPESDPKIVQAAEKLRALLS
jgi:hypothetical protein